MTYDAQVHLNHIREMLPNMDEKDKQIQELRRKVNTILVELCLKCGKLESECEKCEWHNAYE